MKKLLIAALFGCAGMIGTATAGTDAEIKKSVDRLIDLYSDGLAVGYAEFKHFYPVHIFEGQSDRPDYVVLFSIEGFHGGNEHHEYLAVFAAVPQEEWPGHTLHRYQMLGVQQIGGRMWRSFDPKTFRIDRNVVTLAGRQWSDSDAGCCPSLKIKGKFEIAEHGIFEVNTKR